MKKDEIIFLEGMTGIGKSTLAQLLYFSFNCQDSTAIWYHEEVDDHPIDVYNREILCENKEFDEYIKQILYNWKRFINNKSFLSKYLFESQLLLNFIGVLLWFGCDYSVIKNLFITFSKVIRNEKCQILFLVPNDSAEILENVLSSRGSNWEKWYISFFNNSPYSDKLGIKNFNGIKRFWDEVHNIGYELFPYITDSINIFKLKEMNFVGRNEDVLQYLNLKDDIDSIKLMNPEEYCGNYREKTGKIYCKIELINGLLICDFIWTKLQLIPKKVKDEFYIKSFPHELKFLRNNKTIEKIEVIGRDISGLKGKILYKVF